MFEFLLRKWNFTLRAVDGSTHQTAEHFLELLYVFFKYVSMKNAKNRIECLLVN
jgi:hypothetical protein